MMKLTDEDYYGVCKVPKSIFDKIPDSMTIIGSTDTVKYLCANDEETELMKALGVEVNVVDFDVYEVILRTSEP